MSYEIEAIDPAQLGKLVREGITDADPPDVPARDWKPVTLAMRDSSGIIVGGVYGATMWSWLMVDGLWVGHEHRSQGLGRRLLLASEEIATQRGCIASCLSTFDFQAKSFYERHGYREFAKLEGFPPGHLHFHLRKDLLVPPSRERSGAAPEAG
jgi:GNAT superfamily N-acetyltransferase